MCVWVDIQTCIYIYTYYCDIPHDVTTWILLDTMNID